MKKVLLVAALTVMFFVACEKENETKISSNNSDESHNTGQNCMNCHVSSGSGEGWFIIAGSVYNNTKTQPYPNGKVKLTSEPNGAGALIKTIEIDSKGNFYTTENIDFGSGLYVSVFGTTDEQKFMNSKITNGACNSCHGITMDKVWIE